MPPEIEYYHQHKMICLQRLHQLHVSIVEKKTDEILVDIYDDRSLNSGGLDLFSSVRV